MKKFLLKVALFFALVVVMDFAFGQFFSLLRAHAKGGSTANCEYIANQCQDDIIILGSSRATHHYVPQIIEDSLGVSCYNCGEEGNGIVLAYGRFKMLSNRYKPKLIIYEMTPRFDYGVGDPNTKYLGYLRPYYNKAGIKGIFVDFDDELSSLKMKSQMYQNTAKLLPNMVDNIVFRDNKKGYSPLYGIMDQAKIKKNNNKRTASNVATIDEMKLSYVEKLITEAQSQQIPIIFMISPALGTDANLISYEPEIALCKKYDVPYFDFSSRKTIIDRIDNFQDLSHLNNKGAETYTKEIVKNVLANYIHK